MIRIILVSSCLLGLNTKYDGTNNASNLIRKYSGTGKLIPICPEQLGGLTTPRLPAEIVSLSGEAVITGKSKVLNSEGLDVTANFLAGAKEVEKLIGEFPIKAVILKERSPSCGVKQIYDGSFSNRVKSGEGVTTALVKAKNIPVFSEEDITEDILKELLS